MTAEYLKLQRDAALLALDGLLRVVEEIGGYLSPVHQGRVLDAKFILETQGWREQSRDWRAKP